MSTNRLDMVKDLDHLGRDHWMAIATKLGGLSNVLAVLRGTSSVTVEIIRRLTEPVESLVAGATRNLTDFYSDKKVVWVSENFQEHILNGASDGEVTTLPAKQARADLAQEANDAEIDTDLPTEPVFRDRDQFLGCLATRITAQLGGVLGELIIDGKANIFHVEFVPGQPFTVGVRWYRGGRRWVCYASPRDAHRWGAGGRAFGNCS